MNAILKKLKITPPHLFCTLHAPADFEATVTQDTPGCMFSTNLTGAFDSLHWFVRNQADVETGVSGIFNVLKPGVPVWVYYPKGSSGLQTDLNRDAGWDALMQREDVRWTAMISFDATWTAFSFRLKTDKDRHAEAKPKPERAIFQYADSATKTIRLPEDLREALESHPPEQAFFQKLSFSHQREYVEWIITAKQEQTRRTRIEGTLERLRQGRRSPAER